MTIDIIAAATRLTDRELLARLDALAAKERSASAELIAHLAVLESRPGLYAAQGYGSLFDYCTQALRLSEDVACNRIEVAKACRRFPVLLDLLAAGSLTPSSVRILFRHLTEENIEAVLERAKGLSCRQTEVLVAELAPRPDVAGSMRKLPTPAAPVREVAMPAPVPPIATDSVEPPSAPSIAARAPARPVIEPTARDRYRVQFTVGNETHDRLRRVQALMRREIPNGDPGAIFDRALELLEAQVEKTKLGAEPKPESRKAIRRATDDFDIRTPGRPSRHISSATKRTVWRRDGAQCAFISAEGRRCTERSFLEFHHVRAYAQGGAGTVENIALRCRRHNQYEGEMVFGPRNVFDPGREQRV
jgi:5-methylcytosine-specific restriction endonuclease McrA